MSYGSSKWRPWVLDEAEARPFFRRAVEAGINFFDTADMYSLGGQSEEVTGRALREYGGTGRDRLATKVFWPMGDGAEPGAALAQARGAGVRGEPAAAGGGDDRPLPDPPLRPDTPIDETLAALDHLVHAGKVRYIGASSGWAWQMAQALSASERNGWARFVSMQNHYNLVYREEEREMIPLCRAEGSR
jgi:aryl-alcohol dehydrogenase-like predicted oxidoreductase